MAIISIPKSVGSSSIPSGLIVGPLGPLYKQTGTVNFHKYPQDLETSTKGHVVQLVINETVPISLKDIQDLGQKVYDSAGQIISEAPSAVKKVAVELGQEIAKSNIGEVATKLLTAPDNVMQPTIDKLDELSQTGIKLNSGNKKAVAYISLYMPDTMNFTYNTMYDKVTVTNAAAEALGIAKDLFNKSKSGKGDTGSSKLAGAVSGLASVAKNFFTNKNSISTMILKNSGYAINPQQSMLFNGVDLRQFQLAFVFTPTSAQEAREVEQIVKLIKAHSRPEQYNHTFGMFFKPPSTFSVKFLFNGSENTKIPKVRDCIIQSVDVNYAPNGWSTHTDGAPVQTTLTLGLMETEIVDKKSILDGGY